MNSSLLYIHCNRQQILSVYVSAYCHHSLEGHYYLSRAHPVTDSEAY